MFYIGDYVVHSGHGVCVILTEITIDDKSFYKLESISNKMTILIPIEKASTFLRPISSKSSIETILKEAFSLSDSYIKDNKERKTIYQNLLISLDIKDTMTLLKSLYHLAEDKKSEKKLLGSFDTQFLQQAERKLLNEIAIVLDIPLSEARKLIEGILKSQNILTR